MGQSCSSGTPLARMQHILRAYEGRFGSRSKARLTLAFIVLLHATSSCKVQTPGPNVPVQRKKYEQGGRPPRVAGRHRIAGHIATEFFAAVAYRPQAGSSSLHVDAIGARRVYIRAPQTAGRERLAVLWDALRGRGALCIRRVLRWCALCVRGQETSS